jgi:NDP-sugar pyrophosphorylase family protein
VVSGSTVTNSILFNSVHVHSYATVHNCILLNDVDIGEHCRIRNAIIDKHNRIPPGTTIGYDRAVDEKNYFVTDLDKEEGSWLTVIPKDATTRLWSFQDHGAAYLQRRAGAGQKQQQQQQQQQKAIKTSSRARASGGREPAFLSQDAGFPFRRPPRREAPRRGIEKGRASFDLRAH